MATKANNATNATNVKVTANATNPIVSVNLNANLTNENTDINTGIEVLLNKTDVEFNFNSRNIKNLLKRTTEYSDEKIWKKLFKFDMSSLDFSVFKGYEFDLSTPLADLKNKRLVYSTILHYIGRSVLCCPQVHERFKFLLKKRLKDSCSELDPSEYKDAIEKLNHDENPLSVEEILAPYNKLSTEFQKWIDEKITWDQYVAEIAYREVRKKKLGECEKELRLF